jgi:lysophospholipase L1-like esterase
MRKRQWIIAIITVTCMSFVPSRKKEVTVFLIGDSTVADYSLEQDYQAKRHPLTGWGQVFQQFLVPDSLEQVRHIIHANRARVDDRAKGGRSTRTFFEEGRWREVFQLLKKNDVVMIQFGHNDAAVDKQERYVTLSGYKEYLRLFISQAREKKAVPILLTPVARNYPWKNGKLTNVHGEYPQAMKDVAEEMGVPLIDLNDLSMQSFSAKGQEYVTTHYFMNFGEGLYQAYPKGQKDNTHFQPEGAKEVARLVFNALKQL